METLYAVYKHNPVPIGGLIVYTHTLLEVVEKSFASKDAAEEYIRQLPPGEYVVMHYFKKS